MKAIVIFIIALPSLSIQQYYNQGHAIANYQPYTYEKHYVSSKYHRSSSHRHRRPRKYGSTHQSAHLPASYESFDTDTDFDSYQETCECECQRCTDPKPCCTRVCHAECQEQIPTSLVFVPYPYPLVMPDVHPSTPAVDSTTTTTTPTTTTTTATTTRKTTTRKAEFPTEILDEPAELMRLKCDETAPSNRGLSFYDDLRTNMRSRKGYQKDFREQLGIRPLIKPNPVPKYGIVPIPDKILQSLFSQVRNIKRP